LVIAGRERYAVEQQHGVAVLVLQEIELPRRWREVLYSFGLRAGALEGDAAELHDDAACIVNWCIGDSEAQLPSVVAPAAPAAARGQTEHHGNRRRWNRCSHLQILLCRTPSHGAASARVPAEPFDRSARVGF
jgi:hypothetical protein